MTELSTIPETGRRVVSRFEAVLLRMLRAFLRPSTGDSPLPTPTAAGKLTLPAGLSDDCLHLIQDSLGKGCVLYLARAGGWRRERYLRGGAPSDGRLWERSQVADLGLRFSKHSVSFLIWLTAGRPEKKDDWTPPIDELSVGDSFLMFLAYETLRESDIGVALRGRDLFSRNGLIRLMYPDDEFGAISEPLNFNMWTEGVGAAVIEALQPRLHRRWLAIERTKNRIAEWTRMRGIGQSQDLALNGFLKACEDSKRPDLARFLLKAMVEILSRDLTTAFWLGGLSKTDVPGRLADRLDTQRLGLTVLRHIDRLAAWTRNFGGVRFYDDEYAIGQLWLSDWERYHGADLASIAQNLLRQVEPLRSAAVAPGPKAPLPAIDAGLENTP